MENDNKIVELLSEMLIKQDQMVSQQVETNKRLGQLENEVIKLNLQTAENSRAIFKLAEKIESIADLDNRIKKLESAVFK